MSLLLMLDSQHYFIMLHAVIVLPCPAGLKTLAKMLQGKPQ